MTRIVYIGNFRAAPYTTENHVARSFRHLGVDVVEVNQDDASAMGARSFCQFVDGKNPDLVLYTRTHNQTALGHARRDDTRYWSDAWRTLEARGVITASLHLDRFWDLHREHLIHDRDPLFTTQHVFTADGGNQDRWAAAGVNHHWLPPAMLADETGRHEPHADFPYDVVFVGSDAPYHPEYPARGELLRWLRATYGKRFGWFGPGTRADHPVVRGDELGRVYASAKVVAGDSCFGNERPDIGQPARNARYWSDRIPETLGRGGVLVHPEVHGLRDVGFIHQVNCFGNLPGDWDDLAAVIDIPLGAPSEALDRMRNAAVEVVRARHTYTHRAAELLHAVGLRDSAQIEAA